MWFPTISNRCAVRLSLRTRPGARPRKLLKARCAAPPPAPAATPAPHGGKDASIVKGNAVLCVSTAVPLPVQTPSVVTGEVLCAGCLTPAQVYVKASDIGGAKAAQPWWKIVLLGALAGSYVTMMGVLCLTVAPNCPGLAASNPGLQRYIMGAIGFPFGLLMILTCGGELFTGNTALLPAAVYEGKATLRGLAKAWACSYVGNMIGCALCLLLFANTGLLPQLRTGAEMLAVHKVSAPLKETFLRAVAANWFVCLAVWQSIAAQSFGGKFVACLGPISAFVCIGLEHCVANMFFVPLGIIVGADVTARQFVLRNLIPVTLGNIFAGAVLVATTYSLAYGALGKKVAGWGHESAGS